MKPKYHFLNNTKYALSGIFAMLKDEVSFKLECLLICPLICIVFFMKIPLYEQVLLIAVLLLILIAECFNSALEACVDLITQEFHPKAKVAKDCASAGVFFTILLALLTWGFVLSAHLDSIIKSLETSL